jgi:hypothetical protein
MLLGELLIDHRKWLRYQLQRLPFGRYAKARGDGRRPNHQRCAKQVTAKHTHTGACIDQHPEQPGAGNAADAGADSVEGSDGKCPNLDREGFADRTSHWGYRCIHGCIHV